MLHLEHSGRQPFNTALQRASAEMEQVIEEFNGTRHMVLDYADFSTNMTVSSMLRLLEYTVYSASKCTCKRLDLKV